MLLEKHGGTDDPMPATFSLPAGADLRRLLLVLAAFAIYFLAMPLIGNMIASALFLLASMWLLSDDPQGPIVRLAIYAVVIALSFEWFFVRLLKVQMPGACSGNGCSASRHSGASAASNPESARLWIPGPREARVPE